ncbi:hypothetical protein EJ110_NYTH55932 [Nymphaea thermarum]|nr:hypothetical protein EJ110_NYTH55932 [Nymphaea thermarum]
MEHFIKDCPLKKERELKKPEAGPSSVRQTTGRVYATTVGELPAHDLVEGKQLIGSHIARVLFDARATHSFISSRFATSLETSRFRHWSRLFGAQVVQGPRVLLCVVLGVLGSRLPNLSVLGKVDYLSLEFTHPGMSALPLPRVFADPGQQVDQMVELTSYWGGGFELSFSQEQRQEGGSGRGRHV